LKCLFESSTEEAVNQEFPMQEEILLLCGEADADNRGADLVFLLQNRISGI